MLPLACDLGQHFQDFSIRTSQRGKNHLQVKGNIDKTRRMINEMKIVQHVNSTTQQQQEQLLCFPRAFSLSLGGNNRSVCHGLSRNLSLDFANMAQFNKCFLTDYSLIAPEQKSDQLKAHL